MSEEFSVSGLYWIGIWWGISGYFPEAHVLHGLQRSSTQRS